MGSYTFGVRNATPDLPFLCEYSTDLQEGVQLLPVSRPLLICTTPLLAARTVALPFTI